LDAALVGIARTVARQGVEAIETLLSWKRHSGGAIQLSDAFPADLGDSPEDTLDVLFKSLIAQRTGRPRGVPRGALLDKVVSQFRRVGAPVRRGEYLEDFLLDAVLTPSARSVTALYVESFACEGRDWGRAERDAGYFMFALEQLKVDGIAVLQEPTDVGGDDARRSYERICRWASDVGLPTARPIDLSALATDFATEEQLALVMA
jgi:hypothetical protein